MQGDHVVHAFHIPGTLSADVNIRFTALFDMTLVHISSVASNNSDATLAVGTSVDTDGFLVAAVIGDSNVPVEKAKANFDGALLTTAGSEYPRISDGTIVVLTLDHDGASGTAAANVTIVLTFAEG